jgi:hypothetical protein
MGETGQSQQQGEFDGSRTLSDIRLEQEDLLEQPSRTDGLAEPAQNDGTSLFSQEKARALTQKWQEVQSGFVDEPRTAVERADTLVKETIDTLASSFSEMRASLEKSWVKDGEVSTEDLRLALQNYRSFFQRLLSVH